MVLSLIRRLSGEVWREGDWRVNSCPEMQYGSDVLLIQQIRGKGQSMQMLHVMVSSD